MQMRLFKFKEFYYYYNKLQNIIYLENKLYFISLSINDRIIFFKTDYLNHNQYNSIDYQEF